jgi:hypothetical protein
MGLELVHARVAFLAHFACDIDISHAVDDLVMKYCQGFSIQKKDIRAALALSVNACGNVLPCCDRISNTS